MFLATQVHFLTRTLAYDHITSLAFERKTDKNVKQLQACRFVSVCVVLVCGENFRSAEHLPYVNENKLNNNINNNENKYVNGNKFVSMGMIVWAY